MANLTVTASQVLPGPGATFADDLLAGEAITAGQLVYRDNSTVPATWKLADNNLSAAASNLGGVALNGAALGQPVKVQNGGDLTIGAGAAPAVGIVYCLSATAGAIAPDADLATGNVVSILGVGKATGVIKLLITNSLVTKA